MDKKHRATVHGPAKVKAGLALSQRTVDWCYDNESKNSAYKGMINQLTNVQAFSPHSWVPALLIAAYFELYR